MLTAHLVRGTTPAAHERRPVNLLSRFSPTCFSGLISQSSFLSSAPYLAVMLILKTFAAKQISNSMPIHVMVVPREALCHANLMPRAANKRQYKEIMALRLRHDPRKAQIISSIYIWARALCGSNADCTILSSAAANLHQISGAERSPKNNRNNNRTCPILGNDVFSWSFRLFSFVVS